MICVLGSLNHAHSIKMNTKNRREKIKGGILAKGFSDGFRYVPRENTENEESTFCKHCLMGYIQDFNLLNIAFKDLTTYEI